MQDIFELYFQIADSDKDGRIRESEAANFLKGSGLSQDILAKVAIAPTN